MHVLTIAFRAGVDDALRMMCETREVDTVFLAFQLLGMFPFLAVVDLEGVIVLCH